MADDLPVRRIDRDALESIIRRAAELQAGEMDTGESLTEQELLKLGADVGIDGRFLRQALYEQGAPATAEHGFLARWFGPGTLQAGRVVPGEKAALEEALAHWMQDGEALTIKRRLPDRTVWERQKGFLAEMKRGFGVGGKSYALSRARDVTVTVTQLEPGFCHVQLQADVRDRRSVAAVTAGSVLAVVGGFGLGVLGFVSAPAIGLLVVGGLPLAASLTAPVIASQTHQRMAARLQLALEQVLDRLEHGEIKPRHRDTGGQLRRIAEEIQRSITEGIEQSRRQRRRLPPG